MITGKAKVAGVIGWPVAHSLSPALHGHWLAVHAVDGAYVPLPVRPEDFSRAIGGLARAGLAGVNVTLPHKEAAFAIAHDCDAAAKAAGAVNLLVFGTDGRLLGRNTDAMGLAASLGERFGEDFLRDRAALLLGAGGAARAAVLALDSLGCREIRILNRSDGRAATLAKDLQPRVKAALAAKPWNGWESAAVDVSLLLNTTKAGMAGSAPLALSLDPLPLNADVCDIVYNPLETDLLKRARARGHRTADGLGMLMHQAVPAFETFYGVRPAATPDLRRALEKALA